MNGLAMADDVVVPVLIDDFSFTGFQFIMEAIEDVSEFNDNIAVKESTFAHMPICEYKKSATAAQNCLRLVSEYFDRIGYENLKQVG